MCVLITCVIKYFQRAFRKLNVNKMKSEYSFLEAPAVNVERYGVMQNSYFRIAKYNSEKNRY